MNKAQADRKALHDEIITKLTNLTAQRDDLLAVLRLCLPVMEAHTEASHLTDGFRPRRNRNDDILDTVRKAIEEAIPCGD